MISAIKKISSEYPLQLAIGSFFMCACLAGLALTLERSKAPYVLPAPFPPSLSLAPDALTAQAAILYDAQTGRVLFSKNDEMQLPLASITKLMTADTALSESPPDQSITLTLQDLQTEGDSGLSVGQTWKLGELIKYALLVSSNDGMAAVASSLGGEAMISNMNTRAQNLGLSQSYFLDPTGLDLTGGISGGYGSAHDVAMLAAAFLKSYPSFFQSTVNPASVAFAATSASEPTAQPLFDIPGLIGAKTGYTDLAGGNLVAAFDIEPGHPLIAVVLHSTEDGRFSDIRTLVEMARTASTFPATSTNEQP